jgi:hypothetical protein
MHVIGLLKSVLNVRDTSESDNAPDQAPPPFNVRVRQHCYENAPSSVEERCKFIPVRTVLPRHQLFKRTRTRSLFSAQVPAVQSYRQHAQGGSIRPAPGTLRSSGARSSSTFRVISTGATYFGRPNGRVVSVCVGPNGRKCPGVRLRRGWLQRHDA